MQNRSDDTLHICCAFDEKMFLPAIAMMNSVVRTRLHKPLHFHVMCSGIGEEDIAALRHTFSRGRDEVSIYAPPSDPVATNVTFYSPATFYRLALIDQLDHLSRCLYLDCDIIVLRDLDDLYAIDLQGFPIAASPDYAMRYFLPDRGIRLRFLGRSYGTEEYLSAILGMTNPGSYFNSGVIVVDVAKWKALDLSRSALAFCRENADLCYVDQDALNKLIDGRYRAIDYRWNAFVFLYPLYKRMKYFPVGEWLSILKTWNDDAYIAHFISESKPWVPQHFPSRFVKDFWRAIMTTDFSDRFLASYNRSVESTGRGKRHMRVPPRYRLQLLIDRLKSKRSTGRRAGPGYGL